MGNRVEAAFVNHGYTGEAAEDAEAGEGIEQIVVKHVRSQTRLHAAAAALGGRTDFRPGR